MSSHSFKSINYGVQQVLAQQPDAGPLAQLVKVYSGIKPLLTILATLPIIPPSWRAALKAFNAALEAVAASAGEVNADFKAGKDL